MVLRAGARLGPYEILELRGKGGMGEVYRARDTRLDRDVAIKVLPLELSGDETYRKRLEREASGSKGSKGSQGKQGCRGVRKKRAERSLPLNPRDTNLM